MALLTKSKYLYCLQCPKLLWISVNKKELIPDPNFKTQFRFDQGTLIGEMANKLYPNGVLVNQNSFKENLHDTNRLLQERKILFEAGFMIDELFSRADILEPVEEDMWDIIEVKSSTSVKDVNVHDLSFQKYVYEKCGLKIRKCHLAVVNNEYVKKGEIDIKQFFKIEDITEKVETLLSDIEFRISQMREVLEEASMPQVQIHDGCTSPYDCALLDYCWGFLPENSVFNLYRNGAKSFSLLESGYHKIIDLPEDYKLSDKQRIQYNVLKNGKRHVDKEKISSWLSSLDYPLYCIDFEMMNPAIPVFDGSRPYEQFPFQWSMHVLNSDGSIEHFEYLAKGSVDPSLEFISKLKEKIGSSGSVLAFSRSVEMGVLKRIADRHPSFQSWVSEIDSRCVDLIIPFRNFWFYDSLQQGSCSIKAILPVFSSKKHKDLDVSGGQDASILYYQTLLGDMSQEDVDKIRSDLLVYCSLDTEAMVIILNGLRRLLEQ